MPLQFACPYCGKNTTVADQYAGQSGPCAGCGKTVTIPFPGGAGSSAPYKNTGTGAAAGAGVGMVLIFVAIGGIVLVCGGILVLLIFPVRMARDAAQRAQSTNNMRQIVLAVHMYHDTYNCLPPAVVKDKDGKPLYSGFVLLLPYLEQQPLFERFQKDKAWNSPENLPLSSVSMGTLMDPSSTNNVPGRTDYLLVSGPRSALEDAPGVQQKFSDVTDGLSNTILVIEVQGNTSWAEPNTWDMTKPLQGNHGDVVIVGMGDGSVRNIRRDIDRETLRRLVERNDGQTVQGF